MLSKSTLVSTLLGAIVLNLLGYAFYEYIAGSYFESHQNISMGENMDPLFISLGSIIFAFGMANLYRHLMGFGMGLIMYGTAQWMDLQAQIVDAVWCFVYYGITGGIMGWAFKSIEPKGGD
jgi:hypothetical protein